LSTVTSRSCRTRTDLERARLAGNEGRLLGQIRDRIPSGVGTSHHAPIAAADTFIAENGSPPGIEEGSVLTSTRGALSDRSRSLLDIAHIQFATLGSGNHFVEVAEDREGAVWLLLHSGSRGIGSQLATAHAQVAERFCEANGIALEDRAFAYVLEGAPEFDAYIADMLWCQHYAWKQREAMLEALIASVEAVVGEFEVDEPINCHHNYAEEHPGGAWLTRKGAIDASVDRLGIIPGSMGAATYIVRGKGDPESYNTSPHGAGSSRAVRQSAGCPSTTSASRWPAAPGSTGTPARSSTKRRAPTSQSRRSSRTRRT